MIETKTVGRILNSATYSTLVIWFAGTLGFVMMVPSDFGYIEGVVKEGVVKELVFSEWTEISVVYKLKQDRVI